MAKYSIDISYGWAQLGVEPGASVEAVGEVLANAVASRFVTKQRVAHLRPLVDFFLARAQLGSFDDSFAEIKKSYHRQAMALHPDRHKGNQAAEERLKEINAAYELVEEISRQAKAYYKQNENIRRDLEERARQATERERPEPIREKPAVQARAVMPRKYMAASIPRSIRTARLGYLPVQTIIGRHFTQKENDINLIFDVVMLPEEQFIRAKAYLAMPEALGAHLQYGKFSPAYTPRDTKEIIVPPGEANPEKFARDYFVKEFGLSKV
jgi:hypothetical protein